MNGFARFLRQRWPAVALIVSLVVNAFLIGMIATDALKPRRGFSGERAAGFELRRLDDRLPREAVEQVSAELKPLAESLSQRIDTLRTMREEIMQMAAEPSPDRALIDARLAELRAETAAMQAAVQATTYDALLKLPPEQRSGLAQAPDR